MLRWIDLVIFIGAQAVSLFNTVLLLWLGLTVLLTGNRRKPATIAGGAGLLLGALFFMGHTLLIAHTVDFFGGGVNIVWRVMWFVAVIAPYFWGLAIFYYSGDPTAGRWVRRILTAAMFFMVLSLFLIFPLPSFLEFVLAPALAPVIAWLYVPYLFLCFVLPLMALPYSQTPPPVDSRYRPPPSPLAVLSSTRLLPTTIEPAVLTNKPPPLPVVSPLLMVRPSTVTPPPAAIRSTPPLPLAGVDGSPCNSVGML